MREIVLGGAQFTKLSQKELERFLDWAISLGITNVDLAPMYAGSEEMIGNYSKKNSLIVNTKCGLPGFPSLFNRDFLTNQIVESLQFLKIDYINTLFIHSIPIRFVTDEILYFLQSLKTKGLIKNIGYSGHGIDLKLAIEKILFDKYMFTFNALDVSDMHSFNVQNNHLYIKRPLANGVFDDAIWKILKKYVRKIIRRERSYSQNSYEFRFEKMKHLITNNQSLLTFFLNFIKHYYPESKYVIGTNSIKHLNQVVSIENDHYLNDTNYEDYFTELYKQSTKNNWYSLP